MACRGTGGLFSEAWSGMVPPGSVPIKASGRENSMPASCICGAEPAAAIAGAPACLTPPPRAYRPIRASLLLQHGPS